MIQLLLLIIFLAGVYLALTQTLSFFNVLIGLAVGFVIVVIYSRARGHPPIFRRMVSVFGFAGYFLWILVRANVQVAWETITPGFHMTPRIIRYSVDGMNTIQITLLANAITLTPGTLTIDVDDERALLYIHCMYAEDRAEAIAEIDQLRHRMMREVFGQ